VIGATPMIAETLLPGLCIEFRRLAGLPRCVVAMEACAGAHYWAREPAALGHELRRLRRSRRCGRGHETRSTCPPVHL